MLSNKSAPMAVVDLFSHKLSPKVKRAYQTIIYLAVFYVGAILARYGIQYDQWFFESTLHEIAPFRRATWPWWSAPQMLMTLSK